MGRISARTLQTGHGLQVRRARLFRGPAGHRDRLRVHGAPAARAACARRRTGLRRNQSRSKRQSRFRHSQQIEQHPFHQQDRIGRRSKTDRPDQDGGRTISLPVRGGTHGPARLHGNRAHPDRSGAGRWHVHGGYRLAVLPHRIRPAPLRQSEHRGCLGTRRTAISGPPRLLCLLCFRACFAQQS